MPRKAHLKLRKKSHRKMQVGKPGAPTFDEERQLQAQGYRLVAGVDEAGRGALAGPVVAAAVILPPTLSGPWVDLVRDSKQLTAPRREELFHCISKVALTTGVGIVPHTVIDEQGIVAATRMAMVQAIAQLSPHPEALVIDFVRLPETGIPFRAIVNGDCLCFSVACASIIAKVTRDHLMEELDNTCPGYLFSRHKGYGTEEHMERLSRLGPSPVHRRSFHPVRDVIESNTRLPTKKQ